jgi:hypothetical protein
MRFLRPYLFLAALPVFVGQVSFAAPGLLDPPKPPPLEEIVPMDFKLTDNALKDVRAKEHIGPGFVIAKALKGFDGIQPWWVDKTRDGAVPGDALINGDVLLAVNGKAAQKNVANQIRLAQRHADKGFWITRWRATEEITPLTRATRHLNRTHEGTVERCFIDSGRKMYDLTRTLTPGVTRDWRLGPLGVNGWCFHVKTKDGATRDARQIIITAVDETGPSFGKLQVKDVILGTGGKDFSSDARRALAAAVNEAEKQGKLNLKVWRKDKAVDLQIDLPVMGGFSRTAPFDCPKTDKIVDNAVAYIQANADSLMKYHDDQKEIGWINYLTGLGLMATGRDDVMPLVKKLAHESILPEDAKLNIDHHVGMMCWRWSYRTLFLCEYYLLTKDEAVLPTIEEYATKLAMGQSGAGTWGHTYAAKANTGYLHGHLGGYGAINQQGLTVMLALPLAYKCGVKNEEVVAAIRRGNNFFKYFIGKGTIPYGDHGPASHAYDDNGKSGAAAILFDFLKNEEGKRFFSEMVLGSAPSGKEEGHTGHFWAPLWGGIGAARGGDIALQAYMKEMRPIFTLERQPTGAFLFQNNPGEDGDKKDSKERYNCTGARLLQLCYPRRTLYITGKETPREALITEERIEEIFKVGRLYDDKEARSKLSQAEVLDLLKAPLPPSRTLAVETLVERKINCVDELTAMLDSDNKYARYGAAEALRKCGFANQTAADKLTELIKTSTDLTFLTYAVNASTHWDTKTGLLGVAKPAIPVIMEMAAKDLPGDPRGVLQSTIGEALFYNGRANPARGLIAQHGIEEADRAMLVPMVRKILTNENGRARGITAKWTYPYLTEAERDELWADIYLATRHIAPSGIMFASNVRTAGLKLMGEHSIAEGLPLAVWYVRYQKGHGNWDRMPAALSAIESYGAHAKPFIPELKSHIAYYREAETRRHTLTQTKHPVNVIQKLIDKLEKIPDEPKKPLKSIRKQLDAKRIEFPPKPIVIE